MDKDKLEQLWHDHYNACPFKAPDALENKVCYPLNDRCNKSNCAPFYWARIVCEHIDGERNKSATNHTSHL